MRAAELVFRQPDVDRAPQGGMAEKQIFDAAPDLLLAQVKGRGGGNL